MAVDYPTGLRGPLNSVVKTQTPTFTTQSPLSGPVFIEKRTLEPPVLYELIFKFKADEALVFRSWVESHKIYRGVSFNCPIITEAIGTDGAQTMQEVRVVGGDIRSSTKSLSADFFTYTVTVRSDRGQTGLESSYGSLYSQTSAPIDDGLIDVPLDEVVG